MPKTKRIVTAAALALAPVAVLAAGPDDAAAPPVRLGAPSVTKLDWNVRSVRSADLNGDGRADLAVINNDRARIDLLYQADPDAPAKPTKRTLARDRWEPVLDDAPFVKSSLVTGIGMFDLALADFNGDGKIDLAYTGRPDALTVRLQSDDERFTEKRVFDLPDVAGWPGSLVAGDVNGDGRADLLVVGEKAISVLVQDADGRLQGPTRYPLADASFDLKLLDADGDGKADLIYSSGGGRNALRVRFGRGEGAFGPERMFDIDPPRTSLVAIEDGKQRKGAAALAYVAENTDMLTVARLGPPKDEPNGMGEVIRHLAPRVYSTRPDAKTPCVYAVTDVDGDGMLDIAVGDAQGAELLVFLQREKGSLGDPQRYPSPADIRSIAAADIDGDGKGEVFIVSRREKLLAVSRWGEAGRLTYPDPIRVEGDPLAVAAVRLGEKHDPAVAVLVAHDRKRYLATLRPPAEGASEWASVRVELAGLRTDPTDVRVIDANQDGRDDLAIFTPGDPVKLMVQAEDGSFADPGAGADKAAGGGSGLVDRLAASALTTGDADGDGKSELLIATDAYARSMKLDATGRLDVIDQYNARATEATVDAAVVADVDGDGKGEVLLIDRRSLSIQLLARDAAGVYRYAEQVPIGRIDLVEARVLDFDGDKRDDLILFGKDRFWLVPLRKADLAHETIATWETGVKDLSHTAIAAGDLNGDGAAELVLVDAANTRVMEILSRNAKGEWSASLFFKVFEQDPYYSGRGGGGVEPRQMLIADVTGDGKNDLILLVHDRVLVYPQK